jgi:hypothetical protein
MMGLFALMFWQTILDVTGKDAAVAGAQSKPEYGIAFHRSAQPMSLMGQNPKLPHCTSNRRFTSDSGHHQHRGWEGFGCRGPVGLTRLALAVFHAPALATKGCRIAPT